MKSLFYLLLLGLLFSCKTENKTENKINTEELEVLTEATSVMIKDVKLPVSGFSYLPRLVASRGEIHLSWVEKKDSLAILKYANFNRKNWGTIKTVTSGKNWFLNWADFPALGVNGDYMLFNFLEKTSSKTYDYDIKLNLLSAKTQIENILLNTDGVSAEHGFVSMHAYDGGFYVSWLDGRNTNNKDKDENQMSLRNAYVNLDGKITEEIEIDNRVCDCCNTATAITNNGPIVVYRDRSNGEQEIRDISIVRWVNGKWTDPKPVHSDLWKLNGCPVNGPAVDTKEAAVAVAWFTSENDTPRVLLAFSEDNGKTFKTPIRIDSGNAIGRVDVNFLKDNSAVVSWLEPQGEDTILQVAQVFPDGRKGKNVVVANVSADRQSGFPQLEVLDDTIYVAWTDLQNENSSIKMCRFNF